MAAKGQKYKKWSKELKLEIKQTSKRPYFSKRVGKDTWSPSQYDLPLGKSILQAFIVLIRTETLSQSFTLWTYQRTEILHPRMN